VKRYDGVEVLWFWLFVELVGGLAVVELDDLFECDVWYRFASLFVELGDPEVPLFRIVIDVA